MDDGFPGSIGILLWLAAVAAVGVFVVTADRSGSLFPGGWLFFAGGGFVWFGIFLGRVRTGSWFVRLPRIQPTGLEAMIGLTGVVLAACPVVMLLVRFASLYVRHTGN